MRCDAVRCECDAWACAKGKEQTAGQVRILVSSLLSVGEELGLAWFVRVGVDGADDDG